MPQDPLACFSCAAAACSSQAPMCSKRLWPPRQACAGPSPARPACPTICLHPQGAGPLPLPEDVSFLDLSFLREEAPSGRAAGGHGEMGPCGPEVN